MGFDSEPWVGTGDTAREAVLALVPSSEDPEIAWVEGITSFPDRAEVTSAESIKNEVVIIYNSRAPTQWNVEVKHEQTEWRAVLVGGKTLPHG